MSALDIYDIVYSISEFIQDDNNLLNCSKCLYGMKLQYCKLNSEYSLKYYQDVNFKNLVNSKITNTRLQLNLNLSGNDSGEITDAGIQHLANVRELNLSHCGKITDEGMKMLRIKNPNIFIIKLR